MKRAAWGALLACAWLAAAPAMASVFASDSTAGGIVLREGFGARAMGMGSAFTAVADDAACLDWNPAGLIRNPGTNVEASHLEGFDNSAYDQLAYTQNLGVIGLGAGLTNLRGGMMSLDHPDGTASNVQSENDLLALVGLGVNIRENLTFGMNVKFLQSTLAETDTAESIMTDMGIMLDLKNGYLAGFSLQNFGADLKYQQVADPLPGVATIGFSYHLEFTPGITGLFAGDIVKASDAQTAFHFGAEYSFARFFFLRVGVKLGEDLGSSTAGFGFKWENFSMDYAWADMGSFSGLQKVSLDVHW
jgi:hypothetical protein